MDLGVLSLLKWSALAGLTLLSYFKAQQIAHSHHRPKITPNEPIITPLLSEKLPAQQAEPLTRNGNNREGLMTYSQFVSMQKDVFGGQMEQSQFQEMSAFEQQAYKSEQVSTMGGDTRKQTLSLYSDDFLSERQEFLEHCPSTPNASLRKTLQKQYQQRTKFLRRQPNSAGKQKNRIKKQRFAKKDSRREEEG